MAEKYCILSKYLNRQAWANSLRSDAAEPNIWSGSILFANGSQYLD